MANDRVQACLLLCDSLSVSAYSVLLRTVHSGLSTCQLIRFSPRNHLIISLWLILLISIQISNETELRLCFQRFFNSYHIKRNLTI